MVDVQHRRIEAALQWPRVVHAASVGQQHTQPRATLGGTPEECGRSRLLSYAARSWPLALRCHATWTVADVREAKADLLHAIYERIVVAGRSFVSVRLTPAAYAPGMALALPEKVAMARPTGVGRAIATYTLPIEGRDEWLAAAARHLA